MTMQSWLLFSIGSAFFAALTTLFGKIGVSEMNSNLATFIRTLIILAVTTLILTMNNQWQRPEHVSTRGLVFLVLSGIATGLSWLCYYRALQLAPISYVAPVDKLSLALAILLAFIFLKEPLTPKVLLGGGLTVLGALILAF